MKKKSLHGDKRKAFCLLLLFVFFGAPLVSSWATEVRSIVKPMTAVPEAAKKIRTQTRIFDDGVEISDVVYLEAPTAEEFEPLDPKSEEKGALRIGIVRSLPEPYALNAKRASLWNAMRDAGKVLAVVVQSEGAEGIRLNLENIAWPAGAELLVTSLWDPDQSVGPYNTKDLLGSKSFWTETIFSDAVVLEVQVPPGIDEGSVSFDIVRLVHIYVPFRELHAKATKVGWCHNDVTCAESEWRNVGNGVAGIGSIGDAGYLWCTGTLLNNTAEDFTDYFLTAHHCVGNQTEAGSTEYYWFYQTSSCNGVAPNPASVPRTGGGADYLAGRSRFLGSDFALLRLRNATPDGVTYVGWTATDPAISSSIRSIHHPDGSFKRISYGTLNARRGNYWEVIWSSGVTEPGSSGSPLFNASRQVVGQLYGGYSSCSSPSSPDEYGRFSATYPYVSQWLEPEPPGIPNDNFANATVMSGTRGQVLGSNVGATKEAGEPNHAGNSGGKSVWWRWTAPASDETTIDTFGSNFDTLLAVYTGGSVGSLTPIASNDDDGGGRQSRITFYAVAGTTYRIAVDGYNGASGSITLNWRQHNAPIAKLNDYNGNGRSDLAVYDPSGGRWYIRTVGGQILAWQASWGYAGTRPVPGDYSGNGRADLAVYDEAAGRWFIRTLSGQTLSWALSWGFPGARPVYGDYNGNGISDLAVYEEATGRWFIRTMAGQTLAWGVSWGFPGARAVPGDFNGDGKADLAVYEEATGKWYIRTLAGKTIAWGRAWGFPGARAVSGDFNGNGRDDLAVYQESGGRWFLNIAGGQSATWGFPGARPVAGDFNGNGVSDLAVVNTQNGYWYIIGMNGAVIGSHMAWGFPGALYPGMNY